MVADARSGLVLVAVTAWQQVLRLGPFVVGGVVLAAVLGQFDLPGRRRRWLSRSGPLPVVGAACLGGLSPFSTYSTAPLLLQLLREGASPGPVLAFLVASSLLSPQLLLLVLGGLGAHLALAQLAGVLILSGTAGLVASRLRPSLLLHPIALFPSSDSRHAARRFSWSNLGRDLLRLTEWVGLTFVAGIVVATILQILVPSRWVVALLGEGRLIGVLLAGILSVPLYTCGGSAVPVLAGLAQVGMSPAAMLAFLLAGPATRVTALAAVASLLNRRALAAYTVYVTAGAIIIAWLLA